MSELPVSELPVSELPVPELSPGLARAAGLAAGFAADRLLGDPRRWHPVAGFGVLADGLERRVYADQRTRGVLHAAVLVGGAAALGAAAERLTARRPVLRAFVTALTTWATLARARGAGGAPARR